MHFLIAFFSLIFDFVSATKPSSCVASCATRITDTNDCLGKGYLACLCSKRPEMKGCLDSNCPNEMGDAKTYFDTACKNFWSIPSKQS